MANSYKLIIDLSGVGLSDKKLIKLFVKLESIGKLYTVHTIINRKSVHQTSWYLYCNALFLTYFHW